MKNSLKASADALFVVATLLLSSADALAAGDSGSGSGCMVTVFYTNEDGSLDTSVSSKQSPCRPGQSNGQYEYYNPYTDTHKTSNSAPPNAASFGVPPIPPYKPRTQSSSSKGTGKSTSTGSSGSSSQTGGTSSPNKPKTNKPTTTAPRS